MNKWGLLLGPVVVVALAGKGIGDLANKVAFVSDRGGDNDIYLMDADGANPVNLTHHSADDLYPSWSPDGSRIAFTSDRDGNQEIYVMGTDGSNPIRLTHSAEAERYSSWSPDGSKIAFSLVNYGGADIYVMDPDGANPINLSNHSGYNVASSWSPDGSKIAFTSDRDGDFEIYVMNADGSNPTRLTYRQDADVLPSWSPDGSRIALLAQSLDSRYENDGIRHLIMDLYTMNADGTGPVNLTNDGAAELSFCWSSDGEKLAVSTYRSTTGRGSDNPEIFVMNADGTNAVNLTNNRGEDTMPAWSPLPRGAVSSLVEAVSWGQMKDRFWGGGGR